MGGCVMSTATTYPALASELRRLADRGVDVRELVGEGRRLVLEEVKEDDGDRELVADIRRLRSDCGGSEARLLAQLGTLARELCGEPIHASPKRPTPPAIAPYRPFPIELLPASVADAVVAHAEAIGCDRAMVALPTLGVLAASVGNNRRVLIKHGWSEPSILWPVTVADSGSIKSPALDAAIAPLRRWQDARFVEYAQEREEYRIAVAHQQRAFAAWRTTKGVGDPPIEPAAPIARRILVSDVTVEALAPLLRDAPRGLLLVRDELSGWFGSYDAYRGGRGGDVARWLELHRGGSITIDRRKSDEPIIYVPRASVSITGTIQPKVLASVLGVEHWANGLVARLLFAAPPRQPRRWRDAIADERVTRELERVVLELLALAPDTSGEPVELALDDAGKRAWIDWFNAHGARHDELTGDLAATSAKIEGCGARLGLVLGLARDPAARCITAQDIAAGVRLADWFEQEANRVYSILSESPPQAELRELVELLQRRGGHVTVRDLAHSGPRRYRGDRDASEAALCRLVESGRADWEESSESAPGRPTRRAKLRDPEPVALDPKKGDFGSGSNGAARGEAEEPPGFVAIGAAP
jgi:hypothetical protein